MGRIPSTLLLCRFSVTVHHRGRNRMVAGVRYLAQQGCVLHRAATRQSHYWCVQPHQLRTRVVVAPCHLMPS